MADYVSGKEMYAELVIYRAEYDKAVAEGLEKPVPSKKLAECILQIARRLMNSHNFVGYTYKDEMISDAIIKCLHKIHRFDPSISQNCFAFFTQVCWNAAINRITAEQYEASVKAKMIREKLSSDFVQHGVDADADDGSNSFVEFLKENDAYVDYIDERARKKTQETSRHKNKTPYAKQKTVVEQEEVFDLSKFE